MIENNTASLAPGFRWTTAFVGNWSGETLRIGSSNRLAQGIRLHEAH